MEATAGKVRKPAKKRKKRMGSADFTLVALTCALVIFGVIMVFSASYYWSIDKVGNPYNFLIKDLFWAGTGFFIMIVTTALDYHVYKKWAPWLMGGGLLLLVAVLFIGATINNAQRWIMIGPITIMPGEICKICVIIFIGGLQLFCLGIIGQYLAKTYMEVKNRPHYIVSDTNAEHAQKIR